MDRRWAFREPASQTATHDTAAASDKSGTDRNDSESNSATAFDWYSGAIFGIFKIHIQNSDRISAQGAIAKNPRTARLAVAPATNLQSGQCREAALMAATLQRPFPRSRDQPQGKPPEFSYNVLIILIF